MPLVCVCVCLFVHARSKTCISLKILGRVGWTLRNVCCCEHAWTRCFVCSCSLSTEYLKLLCYFVCPSPGQSVYHFFLPSFLSPLISLSPWGQWTKTKSQQHGHLFTPEKYSYPVPRENCPTPFHGKSFLCSISWPDVEGSSWSWNSVGKGRYSRKKPAAPSLKKHFKKKSFKLEKT